jgi:hypothetical protein
MLSSSWESEQRQHDMIDWSNAKNHWMQPEVRSEISRFQDTVIEQEFATAVEQHRVEEIYWVGGEPLMYEQHWRYMQRIIELGDGPRVYARYNTNLSRCHYRGIQLFDDILAHIRDWQICASLDGVGAIGEYIRTGLDYEQWLRNFETGVAASRHPRQMRIDFTLTLPGLFQVWPILDLAQQLGVEVLAKTVFGFTPDIIMSPLALPRPVLDRTVQRLIKGMPVGAMRSTLEQLLTRPTFEEIWPDTYAESVARGKQRMLKLESIRSAPTTLDQILSEDPEIYEWWRTIPS